MSDTVLLVIDIGNTNVSIGVFDYASGKGELAQHWRTGTHREQTSDELVITLRSLFEHERRDVGDVTDVIMSSVVPPQQRRESTDAEYHNLLCSNTLYHN